MAFVFRPVKVEKLNLEGGFNEGRSRRKHRYAIHFQ